MRYVFLFIIALVQNALPVSYEPQIDYFNNFNFKWEFDSLDLETVRDRRHADWRPVKLKVEYVDDTWCSANKQISVEYDGKSIGCGNHYVLTRSFNDRPKIKFNNQYEIGKFYTLIMLDPDAPSRKDPKNRSWLHWIVINIRNGNVKNGTELVSYNPPTPPAGTGRHRYIFFLFKQEQRQKRVETIRKRSKFNINKYASSNGLARVSGFLYFTTEAKPKRIKLRDL